MYIKKKINLGIDLVLGIPKSIYFCFKYLPFKQAIKLPILISYRCRMIETNGKIQINTNDIKMGMILFGIGSVGFIDRKSVKSCIEFGNGADIRFDGVARFGCGTKISCNGILEFGDNFIITGDSLILCHEQITFGNDCLISWHVEIMDTDMHKIYVHNNPKKIKEKIFIGNRVWLASGVKILKGTKIFDNVIVSANTIVTKTIDKSNCIIGGNPWKILEEDIKWKR